MTIITFFKSGIKSHTSVEAQEFHKNIIVE